MGGENRTLTVEEAMKKVGLRSMALVAACLTITAGAITGCTSAKNFLGHLRFWGPEGKVETKNVETEDVASFLSGVRNAGGNPDSHYLLATHYQQQGRYQEAIEEFRKVVMIDPLHVRAYNGMGISYDNLREFGKAREAYETAMGLDPQQLYLYNNLGYSLTLKGDYQTAADIFLKGLKLNPENEQMRNNLAVALAGLGDNDRALAELERMYKPAEAALTLAQIHKREGRLEDAETFFATAFCLDPSLEIKIPDGDRFVARITRSVKEASRAKPGSERKGRALLTILDPSVKETKYVVAGINAAKTLNPETFTLKAPRLEPDYLMNKTAANSNRAFESNPQRKVDELYPEPVRELFAIQKTKGTITLDRLMGGQQWF